MVYRRLLTYARPLLVRMIAGVCLTGIASLATVGYAGAVKWLITAVQQHSLRTLELALLGGVALNIIKNLAQYAGGYTMTTVGQKVVARLRGDLFTRIQYLPLQVFDRWRSGELMSRFDNDVGLMVVGVTQLPLLTSAVLTLVAALGYMFYLDWLLTLFTIAVAPLVSLAVLRFSLIMRRVTKTSLSRIADVNARLQESLESMRIIKAFAREPYEVQRFLERNDAYLGASMKLAQIAMTQSPVVDFLVTLGLLVLAGVSFYELVIGRKSPAELAAFLTLAIAASNPINQLTNYFGDLNKALVGARRTFEILDLPVEVPDAPGALRLSEVRGAVEFRDVHFSYDGHTEVLRGVSARVQPGEIIALVGPSGAGKTTLVNLIPRFYVPTLGSVFVDGHDIRDLALAGLRASIAIVPQDPQLFSDSIEENIRYGRLDATRQEVERAAELANAHKFIAGFAEGYSTRVGARGIRLSGGERQRIAIARAILRDPRILILDEATSSLDAQSEALINEALSRLLVGRTTFIIAHRLSTIRRATAILVLSGGSVVEYGKHEDLLSRGGVYSALYHTQMLQPTASSF
ncbi:MAG: ABC transporter ATP-binding protein [Candidatus Eremiobacter antarcticus]|nr:ABC transporter ATP-binding protein [Candidatus Eremiobacteraeota bacterium]MBC5809112.1 ABC transporter ATP-binding protein [Candidatus Eremiobacteraeota bacterium]